MSERKAVPKIQQNTPSFIWRGPLEQHRLILTLNGSTYGFFRTRVSRWYRRPKHKTPLEKRTLCDKDSSRVTSLCRSGRRRGADHQQTWNTELTVHLTEEGPVVECKGTRLKLSAPQSIDLLCEDFRVQAEGDIHLNANRQLTIESTEKAHLNCEVDIRLRGKVIWLN